jgi:uncharacterized protein (TIGR03435 family)
MRNFMFALGATFFVQPLAFCQTSPAAPVFEAASVKAAGRQPIPSPTANGKKSMGVKVSEDPGRITYQNTTLTPVLMRAYQVKRRQIAGPVWLDNERYDIVATIASDTPKEQIPAMLENLLVERFKMIVHIENRQEKTYALVVGKNGPRLKESTDPDLKNRSVDFDTHGHINFANYTLVDFAEFLTNALDRSVLDMTGLQGHYDISTEMDLAALKMGPPSAPGQEAVEPLPSVFTAIEELGLKLESRDGVVKHVVIDKAEKIPVEN